MAPGYWNGSGWTKIGAYRVNGTWALDFNGNFILDAAAIDRLTFLGGPDWTPMVGDSLPDGRGSASSVQRLTEPRPSGSEFHVNLKNRARLANAAPMQ